MVDRQVLIAVVARAGLFGFRHPLLVEILVKSLQLVPMARAALEAIDPAIDPVRAGGLCADLFHDLSLAVQDPFGGDGGKAVWLADFVHQRDDRERPRVEYSAKARRCRPVRGRRDDETAGGAGRLMYSV